MRLHMNHLCLGLSPLVVALAVGARLDARAERHDADAPAVAVEAPTADPLGPAVPAPNGEDARPGAAPTAIPIHLDIRPGQCPNTLHVSGNAASVVSVPMSVLGNAIDVTQVDLGSLGLARTDNIGTQLVFPYQVTIVDNASPFEGKGCDCHSLEGDGIPDLEMKFERSDLINGFELGSLPTGYSIQLTIFGTVLGGKAEIVGSDCMLIINN